MKRLGQIEADTTYVMVLNDGETFTNLEGCMIVGFDGDPTTEEIEDSLRDDGGTTVRVFGAQPIIADWS